jgi:hypothetical protein
MNMHPLTDQLPDYLDALALRQACGEIEERVTRERDEAREMLAKFRGLVEAQTVLKDVMERREERDVERAALRAELAEANRIREETFAEAMRQGSALRAEVERIRAAIKGQASLLPLLPTAPPGSYARGYDSGMRDTITAISAALTPAEDAVLNQAKRRSHTLVATPVAVEPAEVTK